MSEKPTKGPCRLTSSFSNIYLEGRSPSQMTQEIAAFGVTEDYREKELNAGLALDAFETFECTGLTPRGLVEQNMQLREALTSALKTAEFEQHAKRPWHHDARAALANTERKT